MLRSALVWTLTAVFLATLPVTGAGWCPCRFVKALRTPTTATAVPPKCRCCHEPRGHPAPAYPEDGHQKPIPSDGPCDHRFAVDAAVAGASGERSEQSRGLWDTNPVVDAGGRAASYLAPDALTVPLEPTPTPRARPHLRYAHSFRC